jgi:photosystem II stability/assembly factor-like uncharacterized protein
MAKFIFILLFFFLPLPLLVALGREFFLKLLIRSCLVIILFSSCYEVLGQLSSCQWTTLPNAPILQNFKHDDIYFVNPDTGWVISGPILVGDSGTINKTTDGGLSWTPQFSVQGSRFRSVGFLDGQRGFVGNVGPGIFAPVTDTTIFYKTIDGGNSWTTVNNIIGPKPEGICGISVVNDTMIYACGRLQGPSRFLRSTDAGNTWTSQDMDSLAGMLIDLYFWSPDSGIVVGGTATNYFSSRGIVLFTGDGGQSWETRHITSSMGGTCWKISFPSKNVGYISWETFNTNVIFLKTNDGGLTWQDKPFSAVPHATEAIGFINDSVGWIGSRGEMGFQTTDGGDTWQQGFIGEFINRIRFFGDTLAYACGETVHKFGCGGLGNESFL